MYTSFTPAVSSVSYDYGHTGGSGAVAGKSHFPKTFADNKPTIGVNKVPATIVPVSAPTQNFPTPSFPEEFFCKICKAKCTSDIVYQQHLKGARHKKNVENAKLGVPAVKAGTRPKKKKEPRIAKHLVLVKDPLVGLEFIIEHQKEDESVEERYVCELCSAKCDPRTLIPHVLGSKHRLAFMKQFDKSKLEVILQRQDRDSIMKKSEQNLKLLEIVKAHEAEHGRKEVQVKCELNPFYNSTTPLQQITKRKPENEQQGGSKFSKFDGGRGGFTRGGFTRGGRGGTGAGGGFQRGGGGGGGRGRGQRPDYNNQSSYSGGSNFTSPGSSNFANLTTSNFSATRGGGRGKPFDSYYDTKESYRFKEPDRFGGGYSGGADTYGGAPQPPRSAGYGGGYPDFAGDEPRGRPAERPSMGNLLKDLSKCVVRNEEDAAMALQVSNALTQALLDYRLRNTSSDMGGSYDGGMGMGPTMGGGHGY